MKKMLIIMAVLSGVLAATAFADYPVVVQSPTKITGTITVNYTVGQTVDSTQFTPVGTGYKYADQVVSEYKTQPIATVVLNNESLQDYNNYLDSNWEYRSGDYCYGVSGGQMEDDTLTPAPILMHTIYVPADVTLVTTIQANGKTYTNVESLPPNKPVPSNTFTGSVGGNGELDFTLSN